MLSSALKNSFGFSKKSPTATLAAYYHVLSGKDLAKGMRVDLAEKIALIKEQHPKFNPNLKILQIGSRSDSSTYVKAKLNASNESGVACTVEKLPENISEVELLSRIEEINDDDAIHGLLIQLPLPNHLDETLITNSVSPFKDVDGFHRYNVGELSKRGGEPYFIPCTPNGVMRLLEETQIPLKGMNAVVIGRSDIVGTPVSSLLKQKDCTVTTVHRHTKNVPEVIRNADIIVAACGVPNFVKGEWLKEGAIVIDVGINYIPDASKKSGRKLVGDVDYESCKEKASFITPVPGGVGPMTVGMLTKNVYEAALKSFKEETKLPEIHPVKIDTSFPVPSDIEISRQHTPKPIGSIASELNLKNSEVEYHGHYLAKVNPKVLNRLEADRNPGKYVLVGGVTPTAFGEGKSTICISLASSLYAHLNKPTIANVRQPSLGPSFGVKGTASGAGRSLVVPVDTFTLQLNDIHLISIANNLLAAAIDTRMFHETTTKNDNTFYKRLIPTKNGKRAFTKSQVLRLEKLGISKANPDDLTAEEITKFAKLRIDPDTITIKRVVDVNDRMLREITIGQSKTEKGITRTTGFDIAVASELMAILALSNDLQDMRKRIGRMVVGFTFEGAAITAEDIGAAGAVTSLLVDAIKPNLMQTLEGTPVMVHAGPFANISIGASSIIADRIGLRLVGPHKSSKDQNEGGYVVTEAGFDFTMGGERFMNIKCRNSGLSPDCVVIVSTVKAMKSHGGAPECKPGQQLPLEYLEENVGFVEKGVCNLEKQIANAKQYGVPVVVAINKYATDTPAEIEAIRKASMEAGAFDAVTSDPWAQGGAGSVELSKAVIEACKQPKDFKLLYDVNSSVEEKLETIVQKMYGGAEIELSDMAKQKIEMYKKQGFGHLPICIAKTQYSLSHDPLLKGVPTGFKFPIRDVRASIGAGYLYALAGDIQTIPGLPTAPGYLKVDVDENGIVDGLF